MNSADAYPNFYLYNRLVKAKLFIDQNFGQTIDLENIADEAHFSKFHFIRLFNKIYGKTPYQYLTHVRIENAKSCLQKGLSIAAACYEVGFDSVTSFTGLFKKNCHQTPGEYQRGYMARQQSIKEMPIKFIPNCFAEQKGWLTNSNFEEGSQQ